VTNTLAYYDTRLKKAGKNFGPRPYLQIWTRLSMLYSDKHSSLFVRCIIDGENNCFNVDTWAECYKTFYSRNLRVAVL